MQKFTHTTAMPYGKYQGRQMQQVPADYLLWLYQNDKCSERVKMYVEENIDAIRTRNAEESKSRTQQLSLRMPFGSYKGYHVKEIPAEYLEAMYDNGRCPKNLLSYMKDNISSIRRKAEKDRQYRAAFRSAYQ